MVDLDMLTLQSSRQLVVHTDSSTFKLYLIAQSIKVGCTELEEFWLPTRLLTFESWSPARQT